MLSGATSRKDTAVAKEKGVSGVCPVARHSGTGDAATNEDSGHVWRTCAVQGPEDIQNNYDQQISPENLEFGEGIEKTFKGHEGNKSSGGKGSLKNYCRRRPRGVKGRDYSYQFGYVLDGHEDKETEYKSLVGCNLSALPWKIMDKAKNFICGCFNAATAGTLYCGVGDSHDKNADYQHGEIIGLDVENIKDDIMRAFRQTLADHIRSDGGSLKKGGDQTCVTIDFVPVIKIHGIRSKLYIVEIGVAPDWKFCEDYVYYFRCWTEIPRKGNGNQLRDSFKVKEGQWADAVIRINGANSSVKHIDVQTQVRKPLQIKYKNWKLSAQHEEVIQQKKGTKNTAMQTEDTPKEETASTGSVAHVGKKVLCDQQMHRMSKADGHTKTDPRSALMKIASDNGFEISDNQGLGDCLFYSLHEQMEFVLGVIISHQQLRQSSVKYLERNAKLADGTELFEFVHDRFQYLSWEDYLAKLKQNGTWGDHVVLHAVANLYGVSIRVISSVSHSHEVMIKPERAVSGSKTLVIGHMPDIHYVSLLPKQGVDKTEVKDEVPAEPSSYVQCKDAPGKGDSSLLDKGAGATRNQGNSTSPSSKTWRNAAGTSSPLTNSEEKTNEVKLLRLLFDGGTAALRNIFNGYHPPALLAATLRDHQMIFMRRNRALTRGYWQLLFPPDESAPDSNKFDISLLFVLLTDMMQQVMGIMSKMLDK